MQRGLCEGLLAELRGHSRNTGRDAQLELLAPLFGQQIELKRKLAGSHRAAQERFPSCEVKIGDDKIEGGILDPGRVLAPGKRHRFPKTAAQERLLSLRAVEGQGL